MSAASALPVVDEELRTATIAVLRERGWSGLTLERVAEVAGRARSTLWRQGLTREVLLGALVGELADDFRSTMYPVLTAGGTGRERLVRGLKALCDLMVDGQSAQDARSRRQASRPTTCTRSSSFSAKAPATAR